MVDERQLETILNNVPTGVGVYQLRAGKFHPVYHNPAFSAVLGYTDEDFGSLTCEQMFPMVHEADSSELSAKIMRLIEHEKPLCHTCRIYNGRMGAYRWIRIEGSMQRQISGDPLFYMVFSDASEQIKVGEELKTANEKMQEIINSIPGGVAVYKITEIFETVYFSEGVPALLGYTPKEYKNFIHRNALDTTYWEDVPDVTAKVNDALKSCQTVELEFRKLHRDGHIVWLRAYIKCLGEEDGCPLIHCVFYNISDIKQAQMETAHLVNSIPGGIASYRIEGDRFIPVFISDGMMALSGHTREEYQQYSYNALDIIYEADKKRILAAAKAALVSGEVLDVSCRLCHKDGHLVWIHLNGRRMGPLSENPKFYAVFTEMSSETQLFRDITSETADGIYIIDKDNYDLLYINEFKKIFEHKQDVVGQKCYTALCQRDTPCDFCTLKSRQPDGTEHPMKIPNTDRIFNTHFKEIDWNGLPAYIKYVRDVTDEFKVRAEHERLEQYFQIVVKNLPGGVAVVRCEDNGHIEPEFMSDGFAAMTGMTLEEAWQVYRKDAMTGVHPDDRKRVEKQMAECIAKDNSNTHTEIIYRLIKGDRSYIWVKNTLSLIQSSNGQRKVYSVYHDMTKEREEQEKLRRQYNNLILEHYRLQEPNALIVGHCNITQGKILEINSYTGFDFCRTLGKKREDFFKGLADFIVDPGEKQKFLDTYLERPALLAFEKGITECCMMCFIQFPNETKGRYAQFKMNMVKVPGSKEIVGILTVTDITEQTIEDRILHQLSVTGYDFVVDVDLAKDHYRILSSQENIHCLPPKEGCHSEWIQNMVRSGVVPRDREVYLNSLTKETVLKRLRNEKSYTFAFSIMDCNGELRMMNMTVSAIDLRLERVCLLRTDITNSIREQQGLLNMLAYTFEMACFLDLDKMNMMMYTREAVMDNLPPHFVEDYDEKLRIYIEQEIPDGKQKEMFQQFHTDRLRQKLESETAGYDTVFTKQTEKGLRYKRANVMWGDMNHKTICLVRADVTDMLEAELASKRELEQALALAENANRAKSEFLSAMSHDIRTPLNAVMGMTTLALAHLDNPDRVKEYLQKITVSSRHLLELINEILDMSKIEHSKVALSRTKISLSELTQQILDILIPQADKAKLHFEVITENIRHEYCYGDRLHINQILINILGNAVKFTPSGGQVQLRIEENTSEKGAGWSQYGFTVSDSGIGMTAEFQKQLFEPFMRSKESIQHCVEGTGLGLSIVKGLIEQMGGTIQVESEPNRGSSFRVEVDLEYADEPEFPEADSLYILLALKDTVELETIGRSFSNAGFQWSAVPDWKRMQKELMQEKNTAVPVILMDGQWLRSQNGLYLSEHQQSSVPIVFLTGYDLPQEREQAEKAGIVHFMTKPFFRTAFFNILQKCKSVPDVPEWADETDNPLTGCRFLVAEDNQINAEILKGLMTMFGAEVMVTEDGVQVVEAFREAPEGTYDAILMDIQMPNMNGYEATRTIREMNRPDARIIPIAAMTANAFKEDIQAAREAGMDAHIAKPIDLNVLKKTLGKILRKESSK